ncbi:hypothetical protein BDV3_007004 [Batrachochytrium dendrobatidis]
MSSFNLWELHIKIAPPEEKTNTFIVNDYKAYSILATTTGKENDDLTHNSEGAPLSAHDAYKAIHAHYSTGSTSSRIQLFADLNAIVYDPDQGVEVLYNSMIEIRKKLANQKRCYPDVEFIEMMISRLIVVSHHWGNLRTRYDRLSEEEFSTTTTRRDLLAEERSLISAGVLPPITTGEHAHQANTRCIHFQ